jgi:hypothetical protein
MARRPRASPKKSRQRSAALAPPQAKPAPAPGVSLAGRAAASALLRLNAAETLEQAYDAWRELRLEHAEFLVRCTRERQRLTEQGGFLVGAVRAAAKTGPPGQQEPAALVRSGGDDALAGFLREAEAKLTATSTALEAELAEEASHFDRAFADIRTAVLHRLATVAEKVRPRVRLVLRSVGSGRTLLHVERPGGDEAVLLLHALTGRAPTRYGFLFDDSVDDLSLPPPPLYPEEGVEAAAVHADAQTLGALCRREGDFLPVKGHIPVWTGGPPDGAFYRLLQRGPVLEVELQEGTGFRSVLSREEGERFAGHLLRLKLDGKLDLDLGAG